MATKRSIALSTKGLKLADRVSRKDFRFLCGAETFVCDRFQAAFVSPRIANSMLSDPSLDEFSLTHSDSRSFKILSSLMSGDFAIVEESNAEVFRGLIEDLGNCELSEKVLTFLDQGEKLDVSNWKSKLLFKMKLDVGIEVERDFIASHISELPIEEFRELDIEILIDILRSESMRIPNEDWLLEFIFKFGRSHSQLIGEVRFEYLSPTSIDLFFERISIDELTDRIWQQLWNRSRHRIELDFNFNLYLNGRYIECLKRTPDSPWSGLISVLSEFCGGNVHEKDVVVVSCSSTGRNQCWSVVNSDWNDYWYTQSSPNSWIQFDFKDRFVSLTHYTLKSDGYTTHHLLQWTLQGSIDGNSWTDLDRRNTQELNGNYVTKIFPCAEFESSSTPHFYRYIRLTQTGKDSYGSDNLMLAGFECFGSIVTSANLGFVPSANT
jgi:hypothetical protein